MKCLVCAKEYEAVECPRCNFPDVQIPGDGQNVPEHIKATVDAYRLSFLKSVELQLVIYRWKDANGTLVLDREDRIPLGSGSELMQGEQWLAEKFARIPTQEEIPVSIRITAGTDILEKTVCVPNLQSTKLQQLGACMDQDGNICLLLRNDLDTPTSSAVVPLFG